jgi:hypothetical protein
MQQLSLKTENNQQKKICYAITAEKWAFYSEIDRSHFLHLSLCLYFVIILLRHSFHLNNFSIF